MTENDERPPMTPGTGPPDQPVTSDRPPRYKTAILTWLVIYPTITAIQGLLGPSISSLPLPVRTLIITAILVPCMAYLLIPGAERLLRPWLQRR